MNIPAEGRFPIPIAVVVTKMGALAKATWFGKARKTDSAVGVNSCRQSPGKAATAEKKPASPIRDFLLRLGLANLVLGLETRFGNVAYFMTSAVEELPSANRAPTQTRAVMPLLWSMQQAGALPAAMQIGSRST